MCRLRFSSAALVAVLGAATLVRAQDAPPAAAPETPAASASAAPPAPLASATASAGQEGGPTEPASAEPPRPRPPPPPEPRPADQTPRPYAREPAREGPHRNVDLGPDAGLWWRPARGGRGVDYGPGFGWGAHARFELRDWIGMRALVISSALPVTVEPGALGPDSSTGVEQPDLALTVMTLQAEPTWVVTPRLRLWVGLGAGWGTIVADPPDARSVDLRSARRSGVLVEVTGALGGSFEVVPDWIAVSLQLGGGFVVEQSGKVFRRVQAFRQEPVATEIEYYAGLPELGGTLSAWLGVGVLL